MGFFQAKDGSWYPVSQIASISPDGDRGAAKSTQIVELLSGERVEVSDARIRDLLRRPVQAFAALSGTFTITHNAEEPMSPHKWPVIGWAITNEGDVYPITMSGVNEGSSEGTDVLLPGGQVTGYDSNWRDVAEWAEAQS